MNLNFFIAIYYSFIWKLMANKKGGELRYAYPLYIYIYLCYTHFTLLYYYIHNHIYIYISYGQFSKVLSEKKGANSVTNIRYMMVPHIFFCFYLILSLFIYLCLAGKVG